LVTSWPQVSTVEIRIKGPAGYDPLSETEERPADYSTQEDAPEPPREKFPKGWIKIGIAGLVYKVQTSLTIEQVAEKCGFQAGYEYWLPNGRKVERDEKLRHMFPPGLNVIHFIDEDVPGETR
jgi:hypothetical protein